MNILVIAKTGSHVVTGTHTGTITETSIEALGTPEVQGALRERTYDAVIFAPGCTWADVFGDVYHLLASVVPARTPAVCVPSRVGGVL